MSQASRPRVRRTVETFLSGPWVEIDKPLPRSGTIEWGGPFAGCLFDRRFVLRRAPTLSPFASTACFSLQFVVLPLSRGSRGWHEQNQLETRVEPSTAVERILRFSYLNPYAKHLLLFGRYLRWSQSQRSRTRKRASAKSRRSTAQFRLFGTARR